MPRFRLPRVLSAALLLAAGTFESAWEIAHSVLHLETGRGVQASGLPGRPPEAPGISVVGPDAEQDHGHLVFQARAKPGLDLVAVVIGLPAVTPGFRSRSLTVSLAPFSGAPARASPSFGHTSQPRAPPLA